MQWKKVKVVQSCPTLCNPMDYTVHGILQARILEWVAFPVSRGSSQPRNWTQISHTAGRFFTSWATREAQRCSESNYKSTQSALTGTCKVLCETRMDEWILWNSLKPNWQTNIWVDNIRTDRMPSGPEEELKICNWIHLSKMPAQDSHVWNVTFQKLERLWENQK